MMVRAYAAKNAGSQLEPFTLHRREPGDQDVAIDIQYCGVCHSDIHQARDEWGGSIFPMVPGHEILGVVSRVGKGVTKFKLGDTAAVGCFVDSCRTCEACRAGEEQFCSGPAVFTYNSQDKEKNPTYGGYSAAIVVDQNYTLSIPKQLDPAGAAPLLCAGITTYSPLRRWKIGKGHRVGIIGLGGLGHMGVKFANAFGAEVAVFSTSKSKETDARRLGAHEFFISSERETMDKLKERFDFLLNTVSAPHDIETFLQLLKRDGTMAVVGVPPKSTQLHAHSLIGRRRSIAGSLIGGIRETQEMLNYCGQKNIVCDVEKIPMQQINGAYERMLRADVRYRFVIDMKTL